MKMCENLLFTEMPPRLTNLASPPDIGNFSFLRKRGFLNFYFFEGKVFTPPPWCAGHYAIKKVRMVRKNQFEQGKFISRVNNLFPNFLSRATSIVITNKDHRDNIRISNSKNVTTKYYGRFENLRKALHLLRKREKCSENAIGL